MFCLALSTLQVSYLQAQEQPALAQVKEPYFKADKALFLKHKKTMLRTFKLKSNKKLTPLLAKLFYAELDDLQENEYIVSLAKSHVGLKKSAFKNDLKIAWLHHYKALIPFLDIKSHKALLYVLIKQNPERYRNFNLEQKQDEGLIKAAYFNEGATTDLKHHIFQFSKAEMQFELLVYNGLHLQYANKIHKDNLKWVYQAVLQHEDALFFASKRVQRIFKLVGIKKMLKGSSMIKYYQFRLKVVVAQLKAAVLNIFSVIADSFGKLIIEPVKWLLGYERGFSLHEEIASEGLEAEQERDFEPSIHVFTDIKGLQLISDLNLGVILEARVLAESGQVQLIWVDYMSDLSLDEEIALVFFDTRRVAALKLFGQAPNSKQGYLFRPGDGGHWNPEKFSLNTLERRSLGYEAIVNWESSFGLLTFRIYEFKGKLKKEWLGYQPFYEM